MNILNLSFLLNVETMEHEKLICDLVEWLELNLDKPLNIKKVAQRAGYSRWHLQRVFRKVTGQKLASYIRRRRLAKSAMELRLTSQSVLDVALKYCFDSQQSFTRAFRHQFSVPPGKYRQALEWDTRGIVPPIHRKEYIQPMVSYTMLNDFILVGIKRKYSCILDDIVIKRQTMCSIFWHEFLSGIDKALSIPPLLYGIHESHPNKNKENEQEVYYVTAILPEHLFINIAGVNLFTVTGGNYVKFSYTGPVDELANFFISVYDICIPSLNIIRRPGVDVELYYKNTEQDLNTRPSWICCEYYVPVFVQR
ncbi:helix-turn-helix domain-containing protein [Citrobacter koseri]|uniref:helix-turn-helix domain-containing protein n=1 Tax=Citrobacter koseri TaxID=545 RepID=UPI0029428FC5|nr:helix-turn-helix domain-containing protein [Citrobacter koseri]MEB2704034.1 helix-turn-helix domain-containing protein [Citrobacter koseri]MEB2709585.1 helix-turn-helix domain-containing protein [Citrobacter koseri]WOJ30422.1 helix-turn-helix domain-containing protein [Citrobacter koseri]WOJ34596.1 helix-turn-helix domain-containing protein [Citrobacter koseri]